MTVWRLITHHADPEGIARWSRRNERIALGWGRSGNIRERGYTGPREITETIHETYPGLTNWPFSGQQLWDFCHTLAKEDLVIVSTGSSRVFVAQIVGDYEWDKDTLPRDDWDYFHQRKVLITGLNPDKIWRLGGGATPGYNIRWTLVRCKNDVGAKNL